MFAPLFHDWNRLKFDREDGSPQFFLPRGDAVDFVTKLVEKWDEEEKKSSSRYADYLEGAKAIAREMLNKMRGDPDRLAILQYAVSKSIIARPPHHVYVVKGELHMLQWHCDVNKCDLRLPLSSSEDTVSFLSTYEPIKSLTGSDMNVGEVTVAEALCAVAVCQNEFPVFQFLMREKVDNKGFFVNGMNMLHLAAVNNSLLMVKWLVFHEYIPVDARTNTNTGANALHLVYSHHSHWSMINYLKEEMPGAIDSEGHDYNWYRRAKLKREQPDVDWDGLDLVMSQLRQLTRLVEEGDDFCEARSLLENGALGEYLLDETTWKNYVWGSLGNHHSSEYFIEIGNHLYGEYFAESDEVDDFVIIYKSVNVESGEDELECDDNSFIDWFFKFAKRAIKLNRQECLQWIILYYRQRYRADKLQGHWRGDGYMQASLAKLIDYATWINQLDVAALLQAEIFAMGEEDRRRENVHKFDQSDDNSQCLRSAFVCGVTVEEILDRFAEKTRLLGTLTLTAGDTMGLTMDKLISCDDNLDCQFLLKDKWGPSGRESYCAWPLEVVVWEGHLHLVQWLLELQQLHKHMEVLLKAIVLAAYRPVKSTEMLPVLLRKLQMIEEQRGTLDSPPDRNVIVRELMKAILVSCGSGRDRGQNGANLSGAKLLLPVLQSYGVNVNAFRRTDKDKEYESGDEHMSIFMMTVTNLLRGDTAAAWELLRWVFQLPGLRHDSDVEIGTEEWRKNQLFSDVGKHSCVPDTFGFYKMEVDEEVENIALAIRLIDFLLKSGRFDLKLVIGELTEVIIKTLGSIEFFFRLDGQNKSLEERHVSSLRYLAENWGVDLRQVSLKCDLPIYTLKGESFELLKQQQRERWFMVEALENNDAPLRRLQTSTNLPDVLATTYKDKCTLLHVAAKHGCTEVITWLMENHVDAIDARAKDISGRTALSFARKAGFTEAERAVQMLRAMQIIRRFFRQTAMRLRCVKMAGLRSSACTLIQKVVRRYQVSKPRIVHCVHCAVTQSILSLTC